MNEERLGNREADRLARVERSVRILKDHLQASARELHFAPGEVRERLAAIEDVAAVDVQKPQHRAPRCRLAAARLAHDRERFARVQVEGDAVARANDVGGTSEEVRADREGLHDALDFEDFFLWFAHRLRGRLHRTARIGVDEGEERRAVERTHRAEFGHRREERLRVRVLRRRKERFGVVRLDDFAVAHHGDAVGNLRDDPHVVRDEEHGHADLFLELLDERKDLRLYRYVKRRRRFVGNEKLRAAGERHGDHDALAHAPGELMRVALRDARRIRDAHEFEKPYGFGLGLFSGHAAVQLQTFFNLCARREDRVERRHRLLKDHGDFGAANLAKRRVRALHEVDGRAVAALEMNGPAGYAPAARFHEPHDRKTRDGLSGTGFADERERFARSDDEGFAANGRDGAVFRFEFDAKVLYFENRLRGCSNCIGRVRVRRGAQGFGGGAARRIGFRHVFLFPCLAAERAGRRPDRGCGARARKNRARGFRRLEAQGLQFAQSFEPVVRIECRSL